MKISKEYELYVFDLDNTLIDSKAASVKCYQYAFDKVKIPFDKTEVSKYIGESLISTYSRFKNDKTGYKIFEDAFEKEVLRTMAQKAEMFSDSIDCLKKLKSAGKIIALVTNKYKAFIKQVLSKHGIEKLFSCTVGGDETIMKKPAPESLNKVLEKFPNKKAVYIGDAANDILFAKNAGIDSIYINRDNVKLDIMPTFEITNLNMIL